jgi:hypothetical protein
MAAAGIMNLATPVRNPTIEEPILTPLRGYAYLRDNSNIGITCHYSHSSSGAALSPLWLQAKESVRPVITWYYW